MTSQKSKQTEIGKIPENWKTKTLGEVCEISTGKSNTVDAILDGEYAFFDRSKKIKRSSKYLFDCDAIIIAGEGQTFLPKFYSGKFDLHQRAYALFKFDKNVDIKYVFDYLIFFNKYFEEVAVGATAKSLRLRHFQNLPIPLPPLTIQKQIVKILDEVFESISKSKENAEKNLKNAKELFESYLEEIFSNPKGDWEEKKLGEVCEFENGDRGKNYPSKSKRVEDGIPFVNAGHFNDTNLNFTKMDYISDEVYSKLGGGKFVQNDFLFCLRGSLGKFCFIKENVKGAIASSLVIVRTNKELMRDFLYFYFLSPLCKRNIQEFKGGTAQPNLGAKDLKNFIINLPPLQTQKAIVRKLDALSEQIKQLEEIYKQKLKDLDELKKSMLQKAFSGELTNK